MLGSEEKVESGMENLDPEITVEAYARLRAAGEPVVL